MKDDDSIQMLMFSATFPNKVLRMVYNYIKPNYLYITSGKKLGEDDSVNANVIQQFYYIETSDFNDKLYVFHQILQNIVGKVLVFVNTTFSSVPTSDDNSFSFFAISISVSSIFVI